jgi:hypothetical protein
MYKITHEPRPTLWEEFIIVIQNFFHKELLRREELGPPEFGMILVKGEFSILKILNFFFFKYSFFFHFQVLPLFSFFNPTRLLVYLVSLSLEIPSSFRSL